MSIWLGVSGTWTDPASWSGGVPNAIGADATFFLGSEAVVSLPASAVVTLGSLNLTLSNGISLFVNGLNSGTTERLIFNNGANAAQVNATGDGSFGFLPTGGLEVELASDTIFNITLSDGFKFEIAVPLSGSGTLIKTGSGRLHLNNASTHSGGIELQGGLIDILSDASLGSGAVTISNGGELLARSTMTIDNTIGTLAGAVGAAGDATIRSANGATLTLAGTLSHQSSGTLTFGATGVFQTVIADFSAILDNGSSTSFRIFNTTLQLADAFNAANLFNHAGTGTTRLGTLALLDTNGLATIISTLDMEGGTIRSTTGALDLTVNLRNIGIGSQTGTIQGTAGQDRLIVNLEGSYAYSSLVFSNWTAGIDTIQINGNDAANTISGSAQNEVINGNGGTDGLTSNGGIDTINAGDGNDFITVDRRSNGSIIDGGAGLDVLRTGGVQQATSGTVSLGSITGIELIQFLSSLEFPTALEMTDTQFAAIQTAGTQFSGQGTIIVNMTAPGLLVTTALQIAQDEFFGSDVNLTLNGTSGTDVIKPALLDELTINGNDGSDQIRGGNNRDTINGGTGNDKIMGLGNVDILSGGEGADQFRYLFATDSALDVAADQILDFLSGTDKLDFRILDANPNLAGRQALSFIDTAAFANNGTAQVRYADLGANLRVEIDLDGNGSADMHILLVGAGTQVLSSTDFLL